MSGDCQCATEVRARERWAIAAALAVLATVGAASYRFARSARANVPVREDVAVALTVPPPVPGASPSASSVAPNTVTQPPRLEDLPDLPGPQKVLGSKRGMPRKELRRFAQPQIGSSGIAAQERLELPQTPAVEVSNSVDAPPLTVAADLQKLPAPLFVRFEGGEAVLFRRVLVVKDKQHPLGVQLPVDLLDYTCESKSRNCLLAAGDKKIRVRRVEQYNEMIEYLNKIKGNIGR